MRLLDLFCGPGGLSEGFRMAGISTLLAIDYEKDACATFKLNHPEADVVCADVRSIDPSSLPDCDIVIGGPPCVNFSTAKGGRANILDGLELVQWYLRVIATKRPKYWIMENVPRIALHLPEKIPYRWIGIDKDGYLPVPVKEHFNTADFGVPQSRTRYLIGDYPRPVATHSAPRIKQLFDDEVSLPIWKTLGSVISALPSASQVHDLGKVKDPNYGFSISIANLTDHFLDSTLSEGEAQSIRAAKQNHPYMGRMSFPDDLERPARTVVATQLGRETLILSAGPVDFRRATIRECATLQSFPITYQFTGNSITSRYRQAGDAVPPLLSYNIAKRINDDSDSILILRTKIIKLSDPFTSSFKRRVRSFNNNPLRKFSEMIPGKEVRGKRVELDNLNLIKGCLSESHGGWSARVHSGEGKDKARNWIVNFNDAFTLAAEYFQFADVDIRRRAIECFSDAGLFLRDLKLSDQSLQAAWVRNENESPSPVYFVKEISKIIDIHFPSPQFSSFKINVTIFGERLDNFRLRLLIALVLTAAFVQILSANSAQRKSVVQMLKKLVAA